MKNKQSSVLWDGFANRTVIHYPKVRLFFDCNFKTWCLFPLLLRNQPLNSTPFCARFFQSLKHKVIIFVSKQWRRAGVGLTPTRHSSSGGIQWFFVPFSPSISSLFWERRWCRRRRRKKREKEPASVREMASHVDRDIDLCKLFFSRFNVSTHQTVSVSGHCLLFIAQD